MSLLCPYCAKPAELVTGEEIYRHRKDLASLRFWRCKPCNAYVGCHKAGCYVTTSAGEKVVSDGTLPLGDLANAMLRKERQATHEIFDDLWRHADRPSHERTKLYAWLARQMGLDQGRCHIAMFNLAMCVEAQQALTEYQPNK